MDKNTVSIGRFFATLFLGVVFVLAFQGCAASSKQTVPSSTSGRLMSVNLGTVVATRDVVIEGEAGYVGRTSGVIAGSAVGQTLGKGSGRTLATAGGAVVGGIVGGMVEKELSSKQAQELTITMDDGGTVVVVQERKDIGFVEGDRVRVAHVGSGAAVVSHADYLRDDIY